MVSVRVIETAGTICQIDIEGHAGYADAGADLVCAGVSSIAVGMMNALDELVPDTCILQMKDAAIHMEVKQSKPATQLLLKALLLQLKTLQESYHSYIKVEEQEV